MTEGLPELIARGTLGVPLARRRDPTANDFADPRFEVLWELMKRVDVDFQNGLFSGATGNDVCAVLDALDAAVEASRLASTPAKQETIVDFLRTRAKSHCAIGEADGEIRSDECAALADELEAHPLAASPPETAPALDLDKLALHPYRISRGNWTRCPVTDESEFEPCDDADVVKVREALLVCRQLATEIERLRAAHGSRPAGTPETET